MLSRIVFCLVLVFSSQGCAWHDFEMSERLGSASDSSLMVSGVFNHIMREQVNVTYKVVKGGDTVSVNGMGVPINRKYIATAAHVVDAVGVNEEVDVFYAPDHVASLERYSAHVVIYKEEYDLAILRLKSGMLPKRSIPKICNSFAPGNIVVGAKRNMSPAFRGSFYSFSGINSPLSELLPMNEEFNKQASKNGHPPNKMVGQPRAIILLAVKAVGGNSGGGVFDYKNDCLVGVASMVTNPEDYADEKEFRQRAQVPKPKGLYDNPQALIVVPIKLYLAELSGFLDRN